MSESLTIIEVGPDRLPVPTGATIKQVKLAERMLRFDPEKDTFYDAMLEAGYSPVTADAQARRALTTVGFQRATTALVARQSDRARGLLAISDVALATARDDVRELEPRDRLAFALKSREVAFQTGENTEVAGNGNRWKYRLSRVLLRGFYQGVRACADRGLAGAMESYQAALERHAVDYPRPIAAQAPSYVSRARARESRED